MAEIRTTHSKGYLSNQNPIETFLFLQLNSLNPFPSLVFLSRQVPSVKLEMTVSAPRLVNTKANPMDLPRNCVSKKCQICGSNNHQTRVCCHFSLKIYILAHHLSNLYDYRIAQYLLVLKVIIGAKECSFRF